MKECDPGRAVGVVFDEGDFGRNSILVVAFEIDDAVLGLVPPPPVSRRNLALEIAPALLLEPDRETLLPLLLAVGDLGKVADGHSAAACGNRFVESKSHDRLVRCPLSVVR